MYTRLKGLNLLMIELLINKSSCCVLVSSSTNHHKVLKTPHLSILTDFKSLVKTKWTPTHHNQGIRTFKFPSSAWKTTEVWNKSMLYLVQHAGGLGSLHLKQKTHNFHINFCSKINLLFPFTDLKEKMTKFKS